MAMKTTGSAAITIEVTSQRAASDFTVDLEGTRYEVTLSPTDLRRLAPGARPEAVVHAAFRFLLDREPKEAIMRRFDLTVISRYFPEFESELPRYLGLGGEGSRA